MVRNQDILATLIKRLEMKQQYTSNLKKPVQKKVLKPANNPASPKQTQQFLPIEADAIKIDVQNKEGQLSSQIKRTPKVEFKIESQAKPIDKKQNSTLQVKEDEQREYTMKSFLKTGIQEVISLNDYLTYFDEIHKNNLQEYFEICQQKIKYILSKDHVKPQYKMLYYYKAKFNEPATGEKEARQRSAQSIIQEKGWALQAAYEMPAQSKTPIMKLRIDCEYAQYLISQKRDIEMCHRVAKQSYFQSADLITDIDEAEDQLQHAEAKQLISRIKFLAKTTDWREKVVCIVD